MTYTIFSIVFMVTILMTAGIVASVSLLEDAEAAKAQGKTTKKFGKQTTGIVCGDRLCSEVGVATVTPTVPTVPKVEEPMMEEVIEEEVAPGSVLRLSRANVPAIIPLHQGFYNGDSVYFIVTDSSDQKHADIVTEQQGWKV